MLPSAYIQRAAAVRIEIVKNGGISESALQK